MVEPSSQIAKETAERIRLSGTNIKTLLSPKLVAGLNNSKKQLSPIALILIHHVLDDKGKIKNAIPVGIVHNNPLEIDQKIVHIDSTDSELVAEVTKILKGLEK